MSGYAATSVAERRQNKHKRSRLASSRSKTVSTADDGGITGWHLRQKSWQLMKWMFETQLSLMIGAFLTTYMVGTNVFRRKQSTGNPYSASQTRRAVDSSSYKDLSSAPLYSTSEAEIKTRPPACLDDQFLGSHKFIKIQGVNLHYTEAGKSRTGRPSILLIHGALDFWFTWRKIIPVLAKRFKVYALDLRGCGESEKPMLRSAYSLDLLRDDVACFIRSVSDPQSEPNPGVILVGDGWGGSICWCVAERYPGLVRKMVQIHSPHPYVIRDHYKFSIRNCYKLWPVLFSRLPVLPEWIAKEGNVSLVSTLLDPLVKGGDITPEEVRAYYYNFSRREDITGAIHHLRNWSPWSETNRSPTILTTPTLLLMGDSDTWLPLDAGYKSAEYVEKIKTRVIVGASAWGPTTHPREILDEMGNFLGEPKILQKCYSDSSDDEYDDFDENSLHVGPNPNNSLMGRMVGAISRWNSPHSHSS